MTKDTNENAEPGGPDGEPARRFQRVKGRPMEAVGVMLIIAGVMLAMVGVVLVIVSRATGAAGLPGDVTVQAGTVTVYAPCLTMIAVSILGSILLTVVLNVIARLFNR
ncbi:MAG: DUF2905 domain-containing protein [Anaerolineae bacterium]|nr:DUF2905 domain-containing protein [Anaerolineae bacterium]